MKFRILEASAIILVVLNTLIWPALFLDTVPELAASQEHVGLPAALAPEGLGDPAVPIPDTTKTAPSEQATVPMPATPPAPSPTRALAAASVDETAPSRLRIPAIGVDAPIGAVGLAADGSMDVPKHPANTVWYAPGPRPGEVGSAVIAGHVSWVVKATAVFAKLHTLRPGDTITVQDGAGETVSFVVREIRTYGAAADASDVFFSTDGKAHLNLVTCSGTWDKSEKQYAERLVVFADRVEE